MFFCRIDFPSAFLVCSKFKDSGSVKIICYKIRVRLVPEL